MFHNFLNRALNKIMWKNTVEGDRRATDDKYNTAHAFASG